RFSTARAGRRSTASGFRHRGVGSPTQAASERRKQVEIDCRAWHGRCSASVVMSSGSAVISLQAGRRGAGRPPWLSPGASSPQSCFARLGPRLAIVGLLLTACDREPPDPVPDPVSERPEPIEARVRVQVEAASTAPLDDAGELTGIVEPFASVIVAAETAARVTSRAIERGDRVEADQLLFTLDGSRAWIEYERAQASVEARRADTTQAERERSRSATLHQREGIAAAAHERSVHASEAAAAAEQLAAVSKRAAARGLRDAKIRAPFAGTIAELHAELGDFVRVGTPVATLVDLSRVRLRVGLTAAELDRVGI